MYVCFVLPQMCVAGLAVWLLKLGQATNSAVTVCCLRRARCEVVQLAKMLNASCLYTAITCSEVVVVLHLFLDDMPHQGAKSLYRFARCLHSS